jgi:hypothetical protein
MADEVKIINSPPPAEPVDVKVSPSPGPAQPFDVPTNPSPPPSEPFDVKVYPDPPPGGTFDVPTSPDGPPVEPYDVPTSPDGPPVEPIDVPTLPDGPPLAPIDVPTLPDGPPIEPIDVATSPDSPPSEPYDVPTSPDGPPIEPIDVATSPDGPPVEPIDVAVTPDGPPAEPFDVPITLSVPAPTVHVRDHREIGVPALEYPLSPNPSFSELIRVVKQFDGQLAAFLDSILDIDSPSVSIAGGGALDPRVLAGWFRDYLNTVGVSGVGKFIAEQAVLYAMNPVVARVFDPTYFIKMMIPGSMGRFHTTIDTQAGLTMDNVVRTNDELFQFAGGQSFEPGPNVYDNRPGHSFNDGQDFSIDEMVDYAIDDVPHPFTSPTRDQTGLLPIQKFDSSKYFDSRDSSGRQLAGSVAKSRAASGRTLQSDQAALAASAFINGVVRVPIGANEDPDGCVYSPTQNPSDRVDDDDARIPVSFTDLRKTSKGYRSVYVRPLNLGFSKSIAPEWSEASAFGRVDPIVGYQRTTRSYSLSFDMQAFAPEDLVIMYRKMVWLDSMCYPSYGSDSLMRSGPVIRLRIGDVVSTDNGGLSGIIKSLNFDFNEVMWELKKGMKVPMSFKATLEFLALHDGPVGRMNDDFGVFQLPTGAPGGDTTENGQPAQSREGPTDVATLLPGRYSRFGDPRR